MPLYDADAPLEWRAPSEASWGMGVSISVNLADTPPFRFMAAGMTIPHNE